MYKKSSTCPMCHSEAPIKKVIGPKKAIAECDHCHISWSSTIEPISKMPEYALGCTGNNESTLQQQWVADPA